MTTLLTRKFFLGKIPFLVLMMIQSSHSFMVTVRPLFRNVQQSTTAMNLRWASVRPDLEQEDKSQSTTSPWSQVQSMFDSSSSSSLDLTTTSNQESSLPSQQEEQDGEMSLFVARAILLLVAAIWGTNFAVSVALPKVLVGVRV